MIQDFFAMSQVYKKRIETGENGILDTIKLYSSFQIDDFTIPLYCLGSGTSNIHYRLGELESGLFLATRELVKSEGKFQKACAERYAKEWEKHANRGNLVSKLLIGVKIHVSQDAILEGFQDRYFFIVQDFTDGGNNEEFIPASSGREYGDYKNKDIYYDFDEFGLGYNSGEENYKFMNDNAMVHINLR